MVATALYLGYPSNETELIQKWGISDDRANYLTQQTIWQFSEGEYLPYLQDTSYDNGLIFYSQNPNSPYFNFYGNKGSVLLSGEYTLINEGSNYRSPIINIGGDYTGEFWFDNLPSDVKVFDASTNEEITSSLKTGMTVYFVSKIPIQQLSLTYRYETTNVYYLKANNSSSQDLIGLDKNTASGTIILNTETEQNVSYTVTKIWEDRNNVDGIRPESITVKLKANDIPYGENIQLNKENNWTYTWNELPEKNSGENIQYSVEEVNIPHGYEVSYETNSSESVITNTHNVETTEVSGKKIWEDNENQDGKRPKVITVNLFSNGEFVQSKEVSATDGWKYEFSNLPKYENGQEILYTVTENQVPEYNTEIKGFDITNNYTPEKNSVSVTKAWEDNDDQDGLRPNSIKVQLYANGEKSGEAVELNEGNKWTTTWNDLPEKTKGKSIVYTVKEVEQVPGYTSQVDDSELGNIIITNIQNTNKKISYLIKRKLKTV